LISKTAFHPAVLSKQRAFFRARAKRGRFMTTSETIRALVGKSLKSRAFVANALRAVAQEEFVAGEHVRVAETVRTLRGVLADINLLLDGDTSYLPYGALRETAELIARLDDRIKTMETVIQNYTIH
jgi:Arc/MetJ-type ribon-helix-helix transcriptional regulator